MDCRLCPNLTFRAGALLPLLAASLFVTGASPLANAQPAAVEAPAPAQLAVPSVRDTVVAKMIAKLMPENHISAQGLNDTISKRALQLFIDSLDPLKLYFLQSDIDEFAASENSIDDMVRKGDLKLAYDIFGRFIQRVDERVAVAQELLRGEFEFTTDEAIVIDPKSTHYATNADEARDRWRRQIKYSLLDLKDDETTGPEAIEQLKRRYTRYARRWKQTDSDDLLEMYLTAVTMGYDPHSTYMSPQTLEDFNIQMRLNLDGIGAQLSEKDGKTTVTRVIPGGAAAKHGKLKTDDVIVTVGQDESGEMVDVVEMPLNDVVTLIRGRAGSTVRLGVKAGGVGAVEVYKITRARIELEESAARGEVIEHVSPDTNNTLKIGYINLPSFYLDMESARQDKQNFRSSTRDVHRILDDFNAQGVDGIVLDLSKNGGGSLTEAINLTGLFIDRGPVVQVKNSDGSVQQYADEEAGTAWSGPLVVLTSKFSASASEIFAGAIQDYRRGIVVGDPATHGKGTVQTLMDLGQQLFRSNRANYGALKVTLQQFYLPDGESTQRKGVLADVILPSITSKMDVSEGDLKFALEHDRVKQARHDLYNMKPADLIGMLRQRSMTRVAADKEFGDLLRRIELYVAQKEQNTVSLDEEQFMARRKELDSQKEEEEETLETQLSDEKIYRDNFYNQEVLNVTHDYIDGLRKQNLAKAD
ncbi:carboxy terminal-processing peptidase [Rubripirellula reticaptiva]|uniref:Tail-specific protease n=1 Tax=Rubripirellula reticaptiva TaxID=2528013 RepID=A0A5C6EHN3_9BACT|nr:carboxy terminal-processing peptidase [Rubripirellula reticaptiva]TWU48338.1 Tail-specific protease precursor [Rubripirellula reticaptiva]